MIFDKHLRLIIAAICVICYFYLFCFLLLFFSSIFRGFTMDDREEYKEPEGNTALGNPSVLFNFNSKCFL